MKVKILTCHVARENNKITVETEKYGTIAYIFPFEEPPLLVNWDFAIWGLLPIAMRAGENIHVNGPVSEVVLRSAMRVSEIWEKWLPGFYSAVKISADSVLTEKKAVTKNLTFFSGGIDSSYSSYKAFIENGVDSDCLTVHGMDYRFDDDTRFLDLTKQTDVLVRKMFKARRIIKTNAYTIYDKVGCNPKNGHVTHIFALFSCGSLLNEYLTYRIAADYRLDQQYAVHPYGSNSATNKLMYSANGRLITMDDDVSRSEKIAYLSAVDFDLSSLSICVDYNVRPKNCGKCRKCMRTKAMFYAVNGAIPSIFLDGSFDEKWHECISLVKKIDRVFFSDILSAVEDSPYQNTFPGYKEAKKRFLEVSKKSVNNPFYGLKTRDIIKMLAPSWTLRRLKRKK